MEAIRIIFVFVFTINVSLQHDIQTQTYSPEFTCEMVQHKNYSDPEGKNFWPGTKWPGAVVKYVLHSSLTPEDHIEVSNAFEIYHQKTCIRFEPKTDADEAFVSIENDPETCGLAHVCKGNGYQFARFGGSCRTASVMVHELGHTLCYMHEQDRYDRDNYLRFNGCVPGGKDQDNTLGMLYDYKSAMHYGCTDCMFPTMNGVTTQMCGGDFGVLDAEKFNALYNCGGCFSYRFRPADRLTEEERKDMFPLGFSISGQILYLCRAYHNGDIIPGTFDGTTCYVPSNGVEHQYSGAGVEVFTFPGSGGRGHQVGQDSYRWENVSAMAKAIPTNAIPGGREKNGDTTYVGICTLQRDGIDSKVIGKVISSQPDRVYVPFYGQEVLCTEFGILVCG